jgi:hypothetical protein
MFYDKENELYCFDEYEYKTLKWVEKNLYGDGSFLNPDLRRDMANALNYILND